MPEVSGRMEQRICSASRVAERFQRVLIFLTRTGCAPATELLANAYAGVDTLVPQHPASTINLKTGPTTRREGNKRTRTGPPPRGGCDETRRFVGEARLHQRIERARQFEMIPVKPVRSAER